MRSDRTAGSVSGNILCAKSTKTKRESRRRRSLVLGAAAISMASYFAQQSAIAGTNGTWQGPSSGGLWSASIDWVTGAGIGIAAGQDAVATFGTGGGTVHLDTNTGGIGTLGKLIFNGGTWVLDNDAIPADVFTLSTSTGQPVIDTLSGTAGRSRTLRLAHAISHCASGVLLRATA